MTTTLTSVEDGARHGLSPDDPRHGSTRGFHAGCRESCCRRAIARYEKEGRLARLNGGRAVPALGAQRRIQALMALGWTSENIRLAAGWNHRNSIQRILHGQKGRPCTWLTKATAETITKVYDQLSMRLPEMDRYHRRAASIARSKGYVPPLAWDDIDNPDEQPAKVIRRNWHSASRDDVDEVVVERLLALERIKATPAEKEEAVRRWIRAGGSIAALCDAHGWHHTRYVTKRQECAA